MAVKLMVATTIANGEIAKPGLAAVRGREKPAAKPRRRRSSVFDAEGNEVFITLVCLKCHKTRPLSQFGLRKMADGAIRNQPWCRTCRSVGAEKPARKRPKVNEGSVAAEGSIPARLAQEEASPRPAASTVAAEVAAALAAGLRR